MNAPDAADVLPLALSTDELRAAARLAGLVPPPVFEPAWAPEELGVADAVAVRGLLARGLAEAWETAEGPDVALRPGVRAALDPLLAPGALAEIHQDEGPFGRRRHVLAESEAGRVLAEERRPSIWDLRSDPDGMTLRSIAEPLVPLHGPESTAGRGYPVSGRVLATADAMLARDEAARLPDLLRGDGLDGADAEALAVVLWSAHALVTVRTARRPDGTACAADAVTWLDAGSSGLWLVTVRPERDHDHDPDDDPHDPTYGITPATRAEVRAAVAAVLAGFAVKEKSCPMP